MYDINGVSKFTNSQAVFRGHQVRRHYKRIIFAVGVVEKAILRWRRKKQGLCGIHSAEVTVSMRIDSDRSSTGYELTGEEDFFRISRQQAEARLTRLVVRVQALFRSYKAQQEYKRMKKKHELAPVSLLHRSLLFPDVW
jgi:calmodulin-binding transcription activator